MPKPYVYERQSEYWTSREIENFYLDAGFDVVTFPLTQLTEKKIPADFIFFDKSHTKLFGFQYKALYGNGTDHWPINERQNNELKKFPWIYYCLSELKNTSDYRLALHLLRIVKADHVNETKICLSGSYREQPYSRWGAFFEGLKKCTTGIKINSKQDILSALSPAENHELPWELEKLLVDVFIADFEKKSLLHYSPFLRHNSNDTGDY